MNNLILLSLVCCYTLLSLVPSCEASKNVALGASYTVSVRPNYPHTAPPTDHSALTDGRRTVGHFWTQKTTVGWKSSGSIEIIIDLQNRHDIEKIVFSTARGQQADVFYPANIYAFVGTDMEHFLYVGDIAFSKDNIPGSYQTNKFELTHVNAAGRYILIKVVPKGYYVFCDEIEVFTGESDNQRVGTVNVSEARQWVEIPYMIELAKQLKKNYQVQAATDGIKQYQIDSIGRSNELTHPRSIEKAILQTRANILRKRYPGKKLIVDEVDSWAPLSPVYVPAKGTVKSLSMKAPQNGVGYAAIVITNLSEESLPFRVLSPNVPNKDMLELFLYQVPFLKNTGIDFIPDPLVPLEAGVTLLPGESRMVMLAALGKKTGKWNSKINITGVDETVRLPLNVEVCKVTIPEAKTLNSVNWAYLNNEGARMHRTLFVKDLVKHRINVVVVPPELLPGLDNAGVGSFRLLQNYLELHKGFSKVLLFMGYNLEGYRTSRGKYAYMSTQWKRAFERWYAGILETMEKTGFSSSQLYLYPFDEIRGKDVGLFMELGAWARETIDGVQFYATLGDKNSWKTTHLLDIAQIGYDNHVIDVASSSKKTEFWLYGAAGPAKTLSPYSYYRLMAWKAFSLGCEGVGFWDYSNFTTWGQASSPSWDEYAIGPDTYSVIYEGKNGEIISSRRWEAWRVGAEDYELLVMYAKAKGEKSAKDLAKHVLEKPDDTSRADEIRNKILIELSEIRKYDSEIRR